MIPDAISPIPFIDLLAQRRRLGTRIDEAILRVVDHGGYILGPEVGELERQLAKFTGARHVVTCANGTDALLLALMVHDVGPGDAVFVPTATFTATAEVVCNLRATPVFVDILPDTFTIDPQSLDQAVGVAKAAGFVPRGVIPVDLFGLTADYDGVRAVADRHDLWVICDGAQSFGAEYKGRRMGGQGIMATTSFFPAKPLGCYGDGGAIFADDDEVALILRSLRMHGQGVDKYDNVRIGVNSRLDSIQAAVLLEKLAIFEDEIALRQNVADKYSAALADLVEVPKVPGGHRSVWAQYTVRLRGCNRQAVMAKMSEAGIPTVIYYPRPMHLQPAYRDNPTATQGGLPVAEAMAADVLSLPMHPYLDADTQARIIGAFRRALEV